MAIAVNAGSDSWTAPDASTVTVVPVQAAPFRPPVSRSQYVPAGRPLEIEAASDVTSRLIATNPLSPRENAIACWPLLHQRLTSLPATKRRKPTMRAIEGSRCSQPHWPIVAVSRLEAQLTALVSLATFDGGPASSPAWLFRSKA